MPALTSEVPTASLSATVNLNGKTVLVEWTPRARRALDAREAPLIVELELYFSCLVKKFVHFRADPGHHALTPVTDNLAIYFRPVTSTACSWDEATRRGRQPEIEIDTPVARRLAPKRVFIDFRHDAWYGEYFM